MSRTSDPARAFDAQMMALAVRLIRHGLGTTAFNPSVGCVIADEATSEIIAQGWTQPGGRPHGEKEALRLAGGRARDKTMYVTLEPCAHTGRIPTCADAVITAGLKRVVCALADPNPVIAGRGFDQLRAAGVIVDVGLMADEARALTAGHILYVTEGRPFVQMKLAVSADGLIAPGDGKPVWVTGPEARAHGHMLRAEADAIITGIGTILADDPELTCRLPGLAARSPHRVIVDTRARTPATAKALRRDAGDGPKVWLAARPEAALSTPVPVLAGMHVTAHGHIDLLHLIKTLTSHAIRRVLVEAGPRLSQSFLAQDLVDELVLFRGVRTIGAAGIAPLGPNGFARFDGADWRLTEDRFIGPDRMLIYRRQR
jgi:diaminohydroxyphosphoribosylaminopyrimidine deaminase / 5-amino-6-(5-phosphoribosylamino)uracil reductase